MVGNELLNSLRRTFDLNLYEVKIWVSLLTKGVATASELSDLSNVPRSRAYDVLESLEKKGFIIMKVGKPIQYMAVKPEEVIQKFKKVVKSSAEEKVKELDNFEKTDALADLKKLYDSNANSFAPSDMSGAFKGRQSIYNQLDSMIKGANDSVFIMTSEEGLLRKATALSSTLEQAKQRGVKIKISAPIKNREDPEIKRLGELVELKDNKNVNARFCIVDSKDVMLMLLDDKQVSPNYDVGVWIKSESFGNALRKMSDGV